MELQNITLILYTIYLFLFINNWFELECLFISIVNTNFKYGYKEIKQVIFSLTHPAYSCYLHSTA